jgi:cytochrome b561
LIVLVTAMGWWMIRAPDSDLLLKFLLFQLHKTIGIAILVCVGVRLSLRMAHGRPELPPEMSRWQQQIAGAVHNLLYALLVIVPVLGYFTASTAAVRVPIGIIPLPAVTGANPYWFAILAALHWWLTVALVLLAGAHTLAALHDHLRGHTTLLSMWRGPSSS